jgi:hypothetical protein
MLRCRRTGGGLTSAREDIPGAVDAGDGGWDARDDKSQGI